MKSLKIFGEQIKGLWSLIVGMNVTGRTLLKPQITVHYPRKTVENLMTYRGHIELVPKEEDPFTPRCIACLMCSRLCPSQCIEVVVKEMKSESGGDGKGPKEQEAQGEQSAASKAKKDSPAKESKRKEVEAFRLNYNLCSLCGTCVEKCPVGSLKFSQNVYLAGFSRKDFEFELLSRLRNQAERCAKTNRQVMVEGSGRTGSTSGSVAG
jgi:NADH-quinone oxidoreductase subunit I